jgi:hypothetical protein
MNTPGVGGYVIAWAISVVGFAACFPVAALLDSVGVGPGEALAWFGVVLVLAGFVSVPLAVAGILAVHVACRRVRAQWVHVAAAGLAGVAAIELWGRASPDVQPLAMMLGAATAFGRLAVVPLVWRRRAELAR